MAFSKIEYGLFFTAVIVFILLSSVTIFFSIDSGTYFFGFELQFISTKWKKMFLIKLLTVHAIVIGETVSPFVVELS